MSIELVMPSNHLILCHPLLLPALWRVIESGCRYRWSFAHLLAAHLLLCDPVPDRYQSMWPGGLGTPAGSDGAS